MKKLATQIQNTIPKKITLPSEIIQMLDWVESNGEMGEYNGDLIGTLPGDNDSRTYIAFRPEKETSSWWCFDSEDISEDEINERLCIFATSGDGSAVALWLDDNGTQKIVHIASGSGSEMMCVLAEHPVDFIRLLAIGYDEISWIPDHNQPPKNIDIKNLKFKKWVKDTFKTDIPKCASEIIINPAEMWDEKSNDLFCAWISQFN